MMKDNKKITITLCVCLLVVAVVAIVYVLVRKKNTLSGSATTDAHQTSTATAKLSPGSCGEAVRQLQTYLNKQLVNYYYIRPDFPTDKEGKRITLLDVDGIYGEKTKAVCVWWFGKTTIKTSELC